MIVNTVDSVSQLISFTMPLSVDDVKKLLLDAKEIEKQPHTLHVTLWVSSTSQGTRLFARASPNGAGFFSHSNGQIEKQLLDAVEKGTKWRTAADDPSHRKRLTALPQTAFKAAVDAVAASSRVRLNAANPDPGVLTCSLVISSADLKNFAAGVTKQLYPGAAHLTLWFEPSEGGVAIRSRSLIFESGSLSPVPLPSKGQLESAILAAVEKRMGGSPDAVIGIGSNYKGKAEFWTVLFGFNSQGSNPDAAPSVTRELPAPIDRAWQAALQVITQNQVIVEADSKAGLLGFMVAHSSETGTKYSVHKVVLRFSPTGFGTRLSVSAPSAQETAEESQRELRTIAERIGTEMFIKERLTWLTQGRGVK